METQLHGVPGLLCHPAHSEPRTAGARLIPSPPRPTGAAN